MTTKPAPSVDEQECAECKNCGYSDGVTTAPIQGNWFCCEECWMEWSEFNS